jgi:hypothetical protein
MPPPVCHGASVAASVVLGCPSPAGQSNTTVELGAYLGRPAVVLVTTGTVEGSDERTSSTKLLYLDPDTFLPIGSEEEGSVDYGPTVPVQAHSTYRSGFIAKDAVPPDFFAPASIGWQGVMAPLDQAHNLGITPYWLGDRFDPGGGLPAIVPSDVEVTQRNPHSSSYVFSLTYGLEDNRFGRPAFTMWEWEQSDYEAGSGPAQQASWNVNYPCHQQETISLPGGQATITRAFRSPPEPAPSGTPQRCPDRPFDQFFTVVTLGNTVISIQASDIGIDIGTSVSSYNSLEGMQAIIHGLRSRSGPDSQGPEAWMYWGTSTL